MLLCLWFLTLSAFFILLQMIIFKQINKIIGLGSYFFFKYIVELATFPGNNFAMKKQLEIQLFNSLINIIERNLNNLQVELEEMLEADKEFQYKKIQKYYQYFLSFKNNWAIKKQQKGDLHIQKKIQQLLNLIENMKLINQKDNVQIKFKDIEENDQDQYKMDKDFDYKKLELCINQISSDLYQYKATLNSYKFLFTCIANDFFFQTYEFLKEQLENKFKSKVFNLNLKSGYIQGMLILNKHEFQNESISSLTDLFIKKLENKEQSINEQTQLKKLVIFCEPNAGRYEVYSLETQLLKFFMNEKYNVIIWNYSGYNTKDSQKSSLEIICKNLMDLIILLREKIQIDEIILYGKSMGGFVALNNINLVDGAIIDRSFWNLSLIPRVQYNKYFQIVYDLFIKNFYSFTVLLHYDKKVSFIYNPQDQIIPLYAQNVIGILNLTAQQFFYKKQYLHQKINYDKKFFSFVKDSQKQILNVEKVLAFHQVIYVFLSQYFNDIKKSFVSLQNYFQIIVMKKNSYLRKDSRYFYQKSYHTDLSSIRKYIEQKATQFESLQLDQPINTEEENKTSENKLTYLHLVDDAMKKNIVLQQFFQNFVSYTKKIQVFDLRIYDIFNVSEKNDQFAMFIYFIWSLFINYNYDQNNKEEIFSHFKFENSLNLYEHSIKDLFVHFDKIAKQVNPFDQSQTIHLFQDALNIQNLFYQINDFLTKKEFQYFDFQLSQKSKKRYIISKNEISEGKKDLSKVHSIMKNILGVKTNRQHNVQMKIQEIQRSLDFVKKNEQLILYLYESQQITKNKFLFYFEIFQINVYSYQL